MTAGNSVAGSLFRSLGADDSYFESRARAASKEAEQRWPLFKAVAPSQAQETPALNAQERQAAWAPPEAGSPAPKPSRLSRPGLGQKLAVGLRELGQKTKQEVAGADTASAPGRAARRLRSEAPEGATATVLPAPPPLFRPVSAAAPHPVKQVAPPAAATRQRASGKLADPQAPKAVPPAPPAPQAGARKKGLFAQLAPTAPETNHDAAPAPTALQGVFARLSADTASPSTAAPKKRGTLFGRMGR